LNGSHQFLISEYAVDLLHEHTKSSNEGSWSTLNVSKTEEKCVFMSREQNDGEGHVKHSYYIL